MHTRGSLFADTFPFLNRLSKPAGPFLGTALQQLLNDFFLMASAGGIYPIAAPLRFIPFVQQQCRITAVINQKLRALIPGMRQCGKCEIPIFFQGLPLKREDADSSLRDRSGGLILS